MADRATLVRYDWYRGKTQDGPKISRYSHDTGETHDMENTSNCVIESLLGDRQGMSGAGTGYDSIRNVASRVLRRRFPIEKTATASQQTQQRSQKRTRTPPIDGAAQEIQPAPTQAGLLRHRIK
ncbi:hypothetical protein HHI36_013209 [Cryptolaemus montrouzieri]|uniref:Uncharacterized protein n=1 Tax=Cryptolaemus montrouzieri TaxID=559131 RepID=A0ABD2NGR4_9CUCU